MMRWVCGADLHLRLQVVEQELSQMELCCQECDATIPARLMDEKRGLAVCQKCNAVRRCAGGGPDDVGRPADHFWRRDEDTAPTGITLQQHIDGLRIVRRWRSKAAIGVAFFAVLWDAIVVWFLAAGDEPDPVLSCMALPFALFGAGVTYLALCLFLNHTVIEISGGLLSVRHQPLPWPGKRLAVTDVDHLYCEERTSDSEDPAHDYLLRATTRQGRRVKLLSVREEPEQVLFLAQVLNDRLRASERPARGRAPQ
jgi:hypothetical protein